MDQPWQIQMFGGLRAERGERVIARFTTQKHAALLGYLAYFGERAHPREALIELLWPGTDPTAGRQRLSTALSSLRRQFEPSGDPRGSVIIADSFFVRLKPEAISTDVAEFELALRSGERASTETNRAQYLLESVELYRGELLPGYYQDWIVTEQRRLSDLYFQAVSRLAAHFERAGEWERAIDCAHRAVAVDPLREESHQALMCLLAAAGRPSEALRQYEELERILEAELDTTPSEAVSELAHAIRSQASKPASSLSASAAEHSRLSPPTLPTGTVTFLVVEIDTKEAETTSNDILQTACATYGDVIRRVSRGLGGRELRASVGVLTMAFEHASNALACAIEAQRALAAQFSSHEAGPVRAGMALDTREVKPKADESPGWLLRRSAGFLQAAHGGQVLCSEATAGLLRGNLGSDVRLADLGFYRLRGIDKPERLFAVEYAGVTSADFPPPQAPRAHRSNLPLQITSFFGREDELAALEELLLSDTTRLVTLTGLGGCGKTRLAVETARYLFDAYRGAVWFVGLQDLSEPILILDAILKAMSLTPSPRLKAVDQIATALSDQPSLFVLDNFEQLVEGGADTVLALLERAPPLTCLVTSRRCLNLPGEHEFPIEPLPLPSRDDGPEDLMHCASVQLFVDRAQSVRPDFQIRPRNAETVAELCRRLEGIPLALELAAARSQVLSPARMIEQLEHRFDFLVTKRHGVAERHRTLRAAMEWSLHLMPGELQQCFSRLSVFRGGFTAEAAQAICTECQALDSLTQLRSCSWVRTEGSDDEGGDVRFVMLDTIREFADEQLSTDEREAIRQRHAEYYLAIAEEAEPKLLGEEQAAWLGRLETEHDNLRAALEWCKASDKAAELGRRLAGALGQFWHVRGYPSEGREHLEDLLRRAKTARPTAAQAKALNAAGNLAAEQGDYASARDLFEQSLAIQRDLEDQDGIACSLNNLGLVDKARGDYEAAQALFRESLAIYRELDDQRDIARLLANQGNLAADLGDYGTACTLYEESLAIERKLGSPWSLAVALNNLGSAARALGQYETARSNCEEALSISRELGNRGWEAASLHNLGILAVCEGDCAAACVSLLESLTIWQELKDRHGIACSLEGLAAAALPQGKPEQAARLLGAAGALRETIGAPLPPSEGDEHDRHLTAARSALGDEAFQAAWSEGHAMKSDEAVACAVSISRE